MYLLASVTNFACFTHGGVVTYVFVDFCDRFMRVLRRAVRLSMYLSVSVVNLACFTQGGAVICVFCWLV